MKKYLLKKVDDTSALARVVTKDEINQFIREYVKPAGVWYWQNGDLRMVTYNNDCYDAKLVANEDI